MRRRNPVVGGRHPDLFEAGETPMIMDWRVASRRELERAATEGTLPEEDLDEIEEEDPALWSALYDLDEKGREERVEAVVADLKSAAEWKIDNETNPNEDGFEIYQDYFQERLLDMETKKLLEAASDVVDSLEDYTVEDLPDGIEEILRDPAMFDIETEDFDHYHNEKTGEVFWMDVRNLEESYPIENMSEEAQKALASFRSEKDIKALEEAASNEGVYLHRGLKPKDLKEKYAEISYTVDAGKQISWFYDGDKLAEALANLELEEPEKENTDDVVYTFDDGFYVANLSADELPKEGRKQGICVGRRDMGYMDRVEAGDTAIFSLRTPAGKPKLTFEAKLWDGRSRPPLADFFEPYFVALIGASRDGDEEKMREIIEHTNAVEKIGLSEDALVQKLNNIRIVMDDGPGSVEEIDRVSRINQIKGKGNRLPGFPSHSDMSHLSSPEEVEKAVEFVGSLGVHPEDISDLRPGYIALDNWKQKQAQLAKSKKKGKQPEATLLEALVVERDERQWLMDFYPGLPVETGEGHPARYVVLDMVRTGGLWTIDALRANKKGKVRDEEPIVTDTAVDPLEFITQRGYTFKEAEEPRQNPAGIPVSKQVQKMAQKAYNHPFGGEW